MGAMLDAYARHDAENAALARKQLSKAVLYSRQTDNLQPCSGLSVLIPQDTKNEFETYAEGVDLSFYMPNWIGFVKAYTQQLQGGSYSFSATSAQQMSGTGFLSQIAELFSDSGDVYGWNEETETYTTEGRPDIPKLYQTGIMLLQRSFRKRTCSIWIMWKGCWRWISVTRKYPDMWISDSCRII